MFPHFASRSNRRRWRLAIPFWAALAFHLWTGPGHAQEMDIYDNNYRRQYILRGDKIYDRNYRLQYRLEGDKIYDRNYRLRYRLEDDKIYD